MKVILRWFKLIFALKVNFTKSRMFGIKVASNFMEASTSFLGQSPFYLPCPTDASKSNKGFNLEFNVRNGKLDANLSEN